MCVKNSLNHKNRKYFHLGVKAADTREHKVSLFPFAVNFLLRPLMKSPYNFTHKQSLTYSAHT